MLQFKQEEKSIKPNCILSKLKRNNIIKLKKLFNGIKYLHELPDIVIFTNPLTNFFAIQECLIMGIPTLCITDINCNPDLVPYPIPLNNTSYKSIKFILTYLSSRIIIGKKSFVNNE